MGVTIRDMKQHLIATKLSQVLDLTTEDAKPQQGQERHVKLGTNKLLIHTLMVANLERLVHITTAGIPVPILIFGATQQILLKDGIIVIQ